MSRGRRDSPRRCHRSIKQLGPLVVDVEVHGVQVVGRQRPGVLDGPGGRQVDAVDEHDDDVAAENLGLAGLDGGALLEHRVLRAVLAVHGHQGVDDERHDDDDDPCALGELGDGEDHHDDGADDGGEGVDGDTPCASAASRWRQVVGRHAGAGHGEAGEHPDGVHRDERRHLGAGGEQEDDRGAGEEQDPVGEHESVAPDGELAGEEGVLGYEADQEGEPGEAGVGGQDEDEGRRRLK